MATKFQIPRQTDLQIVSAFSRVAKAHNWQPAFVISVLMEHGGWVDLDQNDPESSAEVKFAAELNSNVFIHVVLKGPHGNAVSIHRDLAKPFDTAAVEDSWLNAFSGPQRSHSYAQMIAVTRAELKAHDLEESFQAGSDHAWTRYRDAQLAVVNSLQQTTETLLVKVADRNAALDKERDERFAALEKKLQSEIAQEKAALEKQIASQQEELEKREKALSDREAAFETKEARYVARQKQGEQIKQIQAWLDGWHLTAGTRSKRMPILLAYISAMVLTAVLTAYSIFHSYDLLKSADDLAKLQWWHWLALTLKTFFPLAAFTTFIIYFIRWSGDWARRHAEEEFLNRTRLIDIGRSSWLLEAVRDAHERNKEIPVDLLKELSRNLFANSTTADGDIHPQAAADVLLQGLSSIRVKSPGGAEVEAKRGK